MWSYRKSWPSRRTSIIHRSRPSKSSSRRAALLDQAPLAPARASQISLKLWRTGVRGGPRFAVTRLMTGGAAPWALKRALARSRYRRQRGSRQVAEHPSSGHRSLKVHVDPPSTRHLAPLRITPVRRRYWCVASTRHQAESVFLPHPEPLAPDRIPDRPVPFAGRFSRSKRGRAPSGRAPGRSSVSSGSYSFSTPLDAVRWRRRLSSTAMALSLSRA